MQNVLHSAVNYNNIPKDSALLKRIPPLKRGESVTYRVHGVYDPTQPDKLFTKSMPLPVKDVIADPETGEVYDIGYITHYGEQGMPVFGEIFFNDLNLSQITLHGGNISDMKKYTYIELCNFLADNPYRDTTRRILIERVSEQRDRERKRNKYKAIHNAMLTIEQMSEEDVLNFIRANRLPDAGSHIARVTYLEDFAQANPEKFVAAPMMSQESITPIVKDALKNKVIAWNTITREFTTSDKKKILAVKKGASINHEQELEDYLFSPEGHATLAWIKAELKK